MKRLIAVILLLSSVIPYMARAAGDAQTKVEPKAENVLKNVSNFYHDMKSFSADMSISMQVQAPGVRQEHWSNYEVTAQKPNLANINLKDGMGPTIVSDGKQMYVYIPVLNKYTKKKAPASLDAIFSQEELALINQGLGNQLFIDYLQKDKPYDALMEDVTLTKYVGEENLDGFKTHHLKFIQSAFDWDMWVQTGDQPVVLKVARDMSKSITEKNVKMDMITKFSNWVVNKELPPDRFKFVPPPSSSEVASFFNEEQPSQLVGKPAPKAKMSMVNGGEFDLAREKGKIVVLDFWASWCAPCTQALPMIQDVANEFSGKGVTFVAVNENEDPTAIKKFMDQQKLNLAVSLDKDNKVGEEYGLTGIPVTVVIGKDGIVKSVHIGLLPDLKNKLSKELSTLLEGKEISQEKEPVPTSSDRHPNLMH